MKENKNKGAMQAIASFNQFKQYRKQACDMHGIKMENDNSYRQEIIQKYCASMKDIFRYTPWLEGKIGANLAQVYKGDNRPEHSIPIPVYDSTLLGFVKEMQATGLMDRNYVYVFSKHRIRSVEEEIRFIQNTELKNIADIFGIVSKYVLGGNTRGMLWMEAAENGIFYYALIKIKELLEIWDKPLA